MSWAGMTALSLSSQMQNLTSHSPSWEQSTASVLKVTSWFQVAARAPAIKPSLHAIWVKEDKHQSVCVVCVDYQCIASRL